MRVSRNTTDHVNDVRRPSAAVLEFAYDENTEQLYVTFSNRKSYVYFPLSARGFGQFYDAPSRGAHLNSMIKPRCHYRQVTGIPRGLPRERG
jgi:hypothetical protein